MAGKRIFTTSPVTVIPDERLHALDIRALLVIALHDGMSTVRGKGGGCYAKYQTLADELGVDITRFSKSLRRLVDFGYVIVEQQERDRRRKTVRVLYSENSCTQRQQSQPEEPSQIVVSGDNYPGKMIAMGANETGEIVDIRDFETPRNPPKTDAQYIPLKGEIDFEESSEINSTQAAHLDDARREEDASRLVNGSVQSIGQGHRGPELPACRINIWDLLPTGNWKKLTEDARISHLERALVRLGWDDSRLLPEHQRALRSHLTTLADEYSNDPLGQRAERMLIKLEVTEAAG